MDLLQSVLQFFGGDPIRVDSIRLRRFNIVLDAKEMAGCSRFARDIENRKYLVFAFKSSGRRRQLERARYQGLVRENSSLSPSKQLIVQKRIFSSLRHIRISLQILPSREKRTGLFTIVRSIAKVMHCRVLALSRKPGYLSKYQRRSKYRDRLITFACPISSSLPARPISLYARFLSRNLSLRDGSSNADMKLRWTAASNATEAEDWDDASECVGLTPRSIRQSFSVAHPIGVQSRNRLPMLIRPVFDWAIVCRCGSLMNIFEQTEFDGNALMGML